MTLLEADDDWRKTSAHLTRENVQRNLRIVDDVKAVAAEAGATPAQVTLAWLLAQGDDIAVGPARAHSDATVERDAAKRLVDLLRAWALRAVRASCDSMPVPWR